MSGVDQSKAEAASSSVIAAQVVSEAVKTAEHVVEKATNVAQQLVDQDEDRTTKALTNALRQVFGEKEEQQQFINISRVPMICQQILKIHDDIAEITKVLTELKIVKKIVFGAIGLVLIGFFGVVASFVFHK